MQFESAIEQLPLEVAYLPIEWGLFTLLCHFLPLLDQMTDILLLHLNDEIVQEALDQLILP